MNADQLLQNVKDRAAIPPSQVTLTDTKILQAATEEMQSYLAPLLIDTHEEFFTTSTDIPIVAGQSAYAIPSRAFAAGVRALKWVDVNGNEGLPLNRIELADIGYFATLASNTPLGFYATAAQIVVLPAPTASQGSLRVYYSRRPAALVSDTLDAGGYHAHVAQVSSIDPTSVGVNLITFINPVGTSSASWDTAALPLPLYLDVASAASPCQVFGSDLLMTSESGSVPVTGFAVASAVDLSTLGIAFGDYVTVAGTSYVPQLPIEWHAVLELRTVARAFAMLGDLKGMQEALGSANAMEKRMLQATAPRFSENKRRLNAWRR